ncbi:RAMP superfamily CRISPR-associated protein [Desulforamulus ruminis]|uniref:CRISPR type III-associated protein domain-containing protein n=1 Tax=Desulforamulus ruminis (strain ATCC 23193 / DSM 2154 / NCIMB 8452 / DL) TaxID=696281 RepID=F6DMG3_DESRL|nr:RAMP superfamily CRISPR-associated protein [Desulforamulus ruminis]AEG61724.1 protein of unknown function DUF324 [Desulforamulus ruminis DSM 2154]
MSWSARIHLKSEAIFGSGQSTPGEVDLEVLHDDYGFPYYGSRTLKGHWLEQTKLAAKVLGQGAASRAKAAELAAVVDRCFGQGGITNALPGAIHLNDAQVAPAIRALFATAIQKQQLTSSEVFNSMTDIRRFTAINDETGTVEKRSLRKFRIIRKDLVLEAEIDGLDCLRGHEIGLLAAGLSSLRYLGTMKHRGKGWVRCALIHKGTDVTAKYIQELREWVTTS